VLPCLCCSWCTVDVGYCQLVPFGCQRRAICIVNRAAIAHVVFCWPVALKCIMVRTFRSGALAVHPPVFDLYIIFEIRVVVNSAIFPEPHQQWVKGRFGTRGKPQRSSVEVYWSLLRRFQPTYVAIKCYYSPKVSVKFQWSFSEVSVKFLWSHGVKVSINSPRAHGFGNKSATFPGKRLELFKLSFYKTHTWSSRYKPFRRSCRAPPCVRPVNYLAVHVGCQAIFRLI
jgi:hypothetical protein